MQAVFNAPAAILTGAGCRSKLAEQAGQLGARRILIITDRFLVEQGVVQPFVDQLTARAIEVHVFDDVQPDPTDVNVEAGVKALNEFRAEAIVAIGGGSPIDTAKIVSAAAANPGPLSAFQGYHRIPLAGPPLIAIPTTAGTGSEATKAAVITDTGRNVKMLILDAKVMPRIAIVDFELTLSMPRSLTANVGVDTLTHGIEAYVSRKANAMTDPLALSAIELTARNLRTAWQDPANRAAREAMSIAALQAGMAFTNSSVCLVHGMSRPLGAIFHLPHGLSNAVLLPAVTKFSIAGAPERYAAVARLMGLAGESASDPAACQALVDGLEQLNRDLLIPSLGDCLKIDTQKFREVAPKMARDGLESGSPANNPVIPSAEEIVGIYEQAW